MNKRIGSTLFSSAIIVAFVMLSSSAQANNKPVTISSQVNELVKQLDDAGQVRLMAVAPDNIVPGDRVLYTTYFQNDGAETSENITITNPIPEQVSYLAGTAQGENCDIVFSIDGGRQWGKPGQLQVRMADGTLRPAQASEYTHIRWNYQSELVVNQGSRVSYQAKLK